MNKICLTNNLTKMPVNFFLKMLKLYLLFCIFSFHSVIAPIPTIEKYNSTDSIHSTNINNQQDLKDLTFFSQVVLSTPKWDQSLTRYKRKKRDYDDVSSAVADTQDLSNNTFLMQGRKETSPKWHVGAGVYLNKERFSDTKKTFVKYESDYCSEEDYSSDEGGSKRKWFKPFSIDLNETQDISIIPSSKILSVDTKGNFVSHNKISNFTLGYHSDTVQKDIFESSGDFKAFKMVYIVVILIIYSFLHF